MQRSSMRDAGTAITGVPRVPPGLVSRPRLHERLESATPLVVAYAPSGYGKTAALTQWASATARRGLWIRVREGMRDQAAFVIELGTALRDVGMIDDENPLWEIAKSMSNDADAWDLALRGLRRIEGEFTLVVDDAERLDPVTIDGLLRLLIDHPPLSLRVATRARSALIAPTTRMRVDVDVIDRDALAFTRDESAALLGDDAETLDTVEAHGSAPAFVRLAVIRDHGFEAGWQIERYADDLVHERVEQWDEQLRAFVLRTALAENLDPQLAAELAPGVDGREMLDRAEREGLGYRGGSERARTPGLFAYVPFLRERIEQIARDRLPADLIRELLVAIARWEAASGFPLSALRRALEAEEWDLADGIAMRDWYTLLHTGDELRDVLRAVSILKLRNRPILAALGGISFNGVAHGRVRALQYFAVALAGARRIRQQGGPAERAMVSLIETIAHRVSGRLESAAAAAARGVDAMRAIPIGHSGLGANEPTAYAQFGVSLVYAGRLADANECFDLAIAAGYAVDPVITVHARSLKAGALALAGDIAEARALLADLDDVRWPDGWKSGYQATFRHVTEAYVHLEGGDAGAALRAIEATAGTMPANEHWAVLLRLKVFGLLFEGRVEEAGLALAAEVKTQKGRHSYPSATHESLRSSRVLIELARGDIAAANRAVQGAVAGPHAAASRARIALAEGDAERALAEIGRGMPVGDDAMLEGSSRTRAEHLALRVAAAAMAGGAATEITSAFERLHVFLDERDQAAALWLVPRVALEALGRITAGGIGDDARRRLAAAIERAPLRAQTLRPQLTARELAVARELVRGGTIDEIAATLTVSPNTVKTQLRSLYRKLSVRTRSEAQKSLAALDIGSPPVEV